jgi:hypothetical protein
MRRSFLAPALSGAVLLAHPNAHACGPYQTSSGVYLDSSDCPTTYGSLGPIISFAFGARKSIGIGFEFSGSHLPNRKELSGVGGYAHGVYYFASSRYVRLNAGAQVSHVLGAEAGFGFLSGSSGESSLPPAFGPSIGVFSVLPGLATSSTPAELVTFMAAFRTTLPFEGPVQSSLDFGVKTAFVLDGRGYYFPSGRPLRVNGAPMVATFREGTERDPDSGCVKHLSEEVAEYMGARWLADAKLEHSAVYAFVALARKLAALGAPPDLVFRALEAASDERRHTSACLAMATRYTGRTWTPPEKMDGHHIGLVDIAELVGETWIDGCIGESLAANMARARARACIPQRGRAILDTIARDELAHSELAFDVLGFLLGLGGEPGELARAEFARLLRHTHAPAYLCERDPLRAAAEGRSDARLDALLDRIVSRGVALALAS